MRNRKFDSRLSVAHAVGDALRVICADEWIACFDDWKLRLQKCIDASGEYFEHLI
jgi:hypothetical protein